jgi:aspartokinase
MVTIAHLVEKEIRKQPYLQETLRKKLVNYAALAEELLPKIEQELQKKIKFGALIMALRRLAEKLEQSFSDPQFLREIKQAELSLKNNVLVLTVLKSSTIFNVLSKLYTFIDFEKGDFLTITQSYSEVTILASQKHKEKFLEELKKEKILALEENNVAISLKHSDKLVHTPGLVFMISRELAWKNINIVELASTRTELILIVAQSQSILAYESLQELINKM